VVSRLWPPLVVCGRVSRARAFGTMYGSSDFGGRTRTCGTSTRGGSASWREPSSLSQGRCRSGTALSPAPRRGGAAVHVLQTAARVQARGVEMASCGVFGARAASTASTAEHSRVRLLSSATFDRRGPVLCIGDRALHRAPSAPRRLGPSPRWCRRRPRAPAPGAPSCARPPPAPSRGSAQRPAPPPAAQAETGSGSNPLLAKRDRLRFCESGRRAQKTRGRLACRFVRRSVSGARPTQNESASNLVTVRQTPLTAMLQPR